jgi:hypothetical protein
MSDEKLPDKPKKKMGRPSSFNEKLSEQIVQLVEKGLTDKQICAIIEVPQSTLSLWKSTKPDFMKTLKIAKNAADQLVEVSLYKRAQGVSLPEEKVVWNKDLGKHEVVTVTKHYPPDTTAAIFWLKNRQPDQWRDVQRHEVVSRPMVVEKLDGSKLLVGNEETIEAEFSEKKDEEETE